MSMVKSNEFGSATVSGVSTRRVLVRVPESMSQRHCFFCLLAQTGEREAGKEAYEGKDLEIKRGGTSKQISKSLV